MNENLLNTAVVKGQIKRYLKLGLSYKEILDKLYDIHLIEINEEELKEFIKEKLNSVP